MSCNSLFIPFFIFRTICAVSLNFLTSGPHPEKGFNERRILQMKPNLRSTFELFLSTSLHLEVGGGKHIENFRGPQNTLVGPIWRCCGQKTRPPGHFWVPFRPNLVFALFTWENGPKLAKKEQISKFAQYSPKNGKCMQQMSNPPFWGVFRRVSGVGS